jgi:heptosyltransferase II
VSEPKNILVIQPSWVGDAVMATPALRALRGRFPEARISYLLRRYVKPIYEGMPWADRLLTYIPKGDKRSGTFRLGRRLREGKFDLAVLLTNSWKTALLCKLAGIRRVVGYEREGRGWLLTDRLVPLKDKGMFIPSPIVHYYMALPRYLGAKEESLKLELFVTERERAEAQGVMERSGMTAAKSAGRGPTVVLNPGAQYGAAKCWLPEYFAAVGDRCVTELGATVVISSAPRERKIVDEILSHMKQPAIDLAKFSPSLGALKHVVGCCDLMITNDTGPRHIAAAMNVPVVTIFGPTHPAWTEIYFQKERQVSVPVHCGPCQKKTCPLDHRCMTRVSPGMVFDAALELLGRRTPLRVRN